MNQTQGLTLAKIGPPLVVIYLAADAGSIEGGWLSWSRKTAMLICACAVTPVFFASMSANLCATVGDMFPQQAVGSVVGIGGMLLAAGAGLILQFPGSYEPMFLMASSAYLLALGEIQLAAPKLDPVRW